MTEISRGPRPLYEHEYGVCAVWVSSHLLVYFALSASASRSASVPADSLKRKFSHEWGSTGREREKEREIRTQSARRRTERKERRYGGRHRTRRGRRKRAKGRGEKMPREEMGDERLFFHLLSHRISVPRRGISHFSQTREYVSTQTPEFNPLVRPPSHFAPPIRRTGRSSVEAAVELRTSRRAV